MVKKTLDLKNLLKLDWKNLIKSKTFWIGLFTAVMGVYHGQLELVMGGAGIITLRDAINKK